MKTLTEKSLNEKIPWAKLKPEYLISVANKGNGQRLPACYADLNKDRLYFAGDDESDMYVENYTPDRSEFAFELYLSLKRGIRCAFRGAGDRRVVYPHDLVDAPS